MDLILLMLSFGFIALRPSQAYAPQALYLFSSIYNGRPAFDHIGCVESCNSLEPRSTLEGVRNASKEARIISWKTRLCMMKCKGKAQTCIRKWCLGYYKAWYTARQCDWWRQCFDKLCRGSEVQLSRGPSCHDILEEEKREQERINWEKRNRKYRRNGGRKRSETNILQELTKAYPGSRRSRRNQRRRRYGNEMHYRPRTFVRRS